MNTNTICLRNGTLLTGYATMEHCAVLIQDGVIQDIFRERRFSEKNLPDDIKIYDVQNQYIAPGFIDTHIHGSFGLGTEDCDPESILGMSARLVEYGVTGFFPTIYTGPEEEMVASIRACVQAMGRETGAKILGIHVEGPFISPEQPGVQSKKDIKPVDIALMQRLIDAGEGKIISMTVAPEIKNMHELALYCIKNNIKLQAGHTNAEYENMIEGIQVGILHATHFFNAMRPLHHRNPGAVGAILIQRELSCEIIADGHHVHPDIIRLLLREKPVRNIVLATDALKPTGQEGGTMYARKEEVVYKERGFYRASDGVIAGSALNMIRGVKNLVSYGVSLGDAVQMASTNPACIFSLKKTGMIIPSYQADITVFDKDFDIRATFVKGKLCYNKLEGTI